ncbi:hypothetical protein [Rhizobium sp. GN54]|uniref:hypothetical protein n=1 Tax=Rhizobium sp. GN54 TaxID=2898150 RepID=UPI001E371A29|nr:hypothetical protein [Rhizobium sp. GN54]MCD2182144.1 hypothetical protein [Rhizobium sp. GN54]
MNENVTGTRQRARRDLRSSLHPLHEAALRIADIGLNRSRARTKDLVGMLLAHGARAWRTAQPEVGIHLHVHRNGRSHPIRMRVR